VAYLASDIAVISTDPCVKRSLFDMDHGPLIKVKYN